MTGLYLKPSTVLSHESLRDRLMQYETEERRKISGFPTAKELRQAKEIAVTRLRSEQEKEEQIGLVNELLDTFNKRKLSSLLQKRKAKDQSGPRPNKVLHFNFVDCSLTIISAENLGYRRNCRCKLFLHDKF